MTQTEILAALLALLVMLVGVAGVVVPVLPDTPLIWLAALGYGLAEGLDSWGDAAVLLILGLLVALGLIVDLSLGPAGAGRAGASWQAIVGSLVGGLIGLVFFPPLGALIGALLGVFAVEYQRRNQDAKAAWEAVKGFAKGYGLSILVRLGIAGLMIAIWAVWAFIERGP
jgi:uncharacterized protein YqgC (DUF456 family)